MTDSEKAVNRRKALNKQFYQVKDVIRSKLDSISKEEAQSRITQIDGLLINFQRAQDIIEDNLMSSNDEEEIDAQISIRTAFENEIHEMRASLMRASTPQIPIPETQTEAKSTSQRIITQVKMRRYSEAKLRKFDGKSPAEFPAYWDLFNSQVHADEDLSEVEKLSELKLSLEGEALNTIKSLLSINGNYAIARELLEKTYKNNKILINTYINNMVYEKHAADTAADLKRILDCFKNNVNGLKQLNEPVGEWNSILVFHLTTKFNPKVREEWELKSSPDNVDKLETVYEFLENRIRALMVCNQLSSFKNKYANKDTNVNNSKPGNVNNKPNNSIRANLATTPDESKPRVFKCVFCSGDHMNFRCPTLSNKSQKDILNILKKSKVCINCMRPNHSAQECTREKCRKCSEPHHTSLHMDKTSENCDSTAPSQPSKRNSSGQKSQSQSNTSTFNDNENTIVASLARSINAFTSNMLGTLSLLAYDSAGKPHKVRAMFDPGSQAPFASPRLAHRLKLPLEKSVYPILGINSIQSYSNYSTQIRIATLDEKYTFTLDALLLNSSSPNIPSKPLDHLLDKVSGLNLADPQFHKPGPIDLIIDVRLFPKILRPGIVEGNSTEVGRVNSIFGWIICGEIPTDDRHICYKPPVISNLAIDQLLEKFWTMEEASLPSSPVKCDVAESHYIENTVRLPCGRFMVRLPFSESPKVLGESRSVAVRILKSSFPRLREEQQSQYRTFMQEYIDLGHMSPISPHSITVKPHYYLPHHAIFKDSTTSKIRVVFNGSKKSSSKKSLNEILHTGHVVQQELFNILLRFRFHTVGICSDAEKMYRMVLVAPEDRPLQRIVWFDENHNVIDYELNTLTYGTASASFLSTRTVQELATQEATRYPTASPIALRDFYVDDLISGGDSPQQASSIIHEMIPLMASGGFNLRKWSTNAPEILASLKNNQTNSDPFLLVQEEGTNALGIKWLTSQDMFLINVNLKSIPNPITKRVIVSESSRLFDPLGLLSPVIILAKILIQSLWLTGVNWDAEIPTALRHKWLKIREQLCSTSFKIPRLVCSNITSFELHGFSDASQAAYAACIYIRSISCNSNVLVRLLCSKTRVAPLKTISIPRLELCAAVLLSRLVKKVIDTLHRQPKTIELWTDSTIVLTWLRKTPTHWKTFVANRVSEIQQSTTPEMWKHIPTKQNPADIASRGVLAKNLNDSLWWTGPQFLTEIKAKNRPKLFLCEDPSSKSESRSEKISSFTTLLSPSNGKEIFSRYSNPRTLIHIVATCRRFCANTKKPKSKRVTGQLSQQEISNASHLLIKLIQYESFLPEIKKLTVKKRVSKHSKLLSLSPFLDTDGLLRVSGRLEKSLLSYDEKHPIILPQNHPFTTMLIRKVHLDLLHGTRDAVLATLLNKYWIIHGKNAVKKVLHNCVRCRRYAARTCSQLMGQLPSYRVNPSFHAFTHTGVDLGGPFEIRNSFSNSRAFIKAYFVLFVCTQTKAVHLELVTSLSTNTFLIALSNFINRRGQPAAIYSDNGSNFVGASNELKALFKSIESGCASKNVEWHFIPPRAPHFGGLWESGVKLVKRSLFAVLKSTKSVTYEEFYSLLVRIEACINSRPICSISDDPNSLDVITPGHFIIGRSLSAIPHILTTNQSVKNRLFMLEELSREFWKKWSRLYLRSMQLRPKWRQEQKNLKAGDLVVVSEENILPSNWLLGRIEKTHPGSDGLVRVCSLRTKNGTFQRPISKLIYIPTDENDSIS